MKLPTYHLLSVILLACAWTLPISATETNATHKKVLYFSKSSNFEHSVVKRRAGRPSFSEQVLAELGPRHGIQFTFSKDGSLFSRDYLAQFDAVMFYTSGDLLSVGKDGNPPLTPEGKAALLEAIASGSLGFVGIHSAADTFHTGETVETNTNQPRAWRYRTLGAEADPYLRMLGGELIVHGTQQIARARVTNPQFPGLSQLGAEIELLEEWYSLTEFAPDMHVLLLQETSTMRDPHANDTDWPPAGWDTPYMRPAFPNTWARSHGKGRVFYTGLGHREDVWLSAQFEAILFGGLAWVLHTSDAATPPNLDTVAPGARELPPVSAPVAGLPKWARELPPPTIPATHK
jgi:type 1 glutamine amidotransferase